MTEKLFGQIDINTSDKRILECFNSCLYEIPVYQRPYAWEKDQLEDFWNDVALNQQDYFLGATVTYISERRDLFRHTFMIIDGQQRLTTATIALAAIRDTFQMCMKNDDTTEEMRRKYELGLNKTQQYLVPEDDLGNKHPIIKRPEDSYSKKILHLSEIDGLRFDKTSTNRIDFAHAHFLSEINKQLAELADPQERLAQLINLRDNILRARVIQIELMSEEDGFMVFETLNARGLDLELPDLIKNLIIKNGASNDEDRKNIADRWRQLRDKIDISTPSDSNPASNNPGSLFSRFIWQSWNSRRKETKEAKLFKALKDELLRQEHNPEEIKAQCIQYLEDLEVDAEIYTHLDTLEITTKRNSGSKKSFLKLAAVVDSVRALKIFNVSVANSALLAAIRSYHNGKLKRADLIRLTEALENYHFHYNALGAVGSNGGMRSRYNRLALDIHRASTQTEAEQLVSDLITALQTSALNGRLAERSRTQFLHLFYTGGSLTSQDRQMGRASLIQYILLKMAQEIHHLQKGSPFNTDQLSIEHIRPKKKAGEELNKTHPESHIGNLTILDKETNNKIKDWDFDRKRPFLKKSILIDDSLGEWLSEDEKHEITHEDILARGERLRDIALEEVWKI